MFELPDCEDYDYQIRLDPYLEKELILKLAEKGISGIDDYINEQVKKDKKIVENIHKLRSILKRQAEKIILRKKQEYKNLQEKSKGKLFSESNYLMRKRKKVGNELAELDSISLEKIIGEDDLIQLILNAQDVEKKFSFLRKIKKLLIKILRVIANFFKKLIAKILRKKKKQLKKETTAYFTSHEFGSAFHDFDGQIKNALKSKEFSSYINTHMGGKRRLMFDEKEYLEETKKIIKDRLEKKMRQEKKKVEKKKEGYQHKLDEIKKEEENKKIEEEDELERLKKLYENEKQLIEKRVKEKPEELLRESVLENLKKSNYLKEKDGKLEITSNLIDRFADIILSNELHSLPSNYQARFGTSTQREGIYEKDKMLSVHEISRMDIADSLIQSRISHPEDRHIYDEDIIVKRELTGLILHVVIMFDKSYSMEENNRIQAAKKAVLALYKAVKKQNPKNIIDLIGFDTNINIMDLIDVWEAEPIGFTNIGGVLRVANSLFYESKADNNFAYLITDGLPEAYTDSNGNDIIAEPNVSLNYALEEAKKIEGKLTMILLEPKDNLYVESAKKIVNATPNGKLVITDPNELAKEMLGDYIKDTL